VSGGVGVVSFKVKGEPMLYLFLLAIPVGVLILACIIQKGPDPKCAKQTPERKRAYDQMYASSHNPST
jgi:hypothetical protein